LVSAEKGEEGKEYLRLTARGNADCARGALGPKGMIRKLKKDLGEKKRRTEIRKQVLPPTKKTFTRTIDANPAPPRRSDFKTNI